MRNADQDGRGDDVIVLPRVSEAERLRRWRLVLGAAAESEVASGSGLDGDEAPAVGSGGSGRGEGEGEGEGDGDADAHGDGAGSDDGGSDAAGDGEGDGPSVGGRVPGAADGLPGGLGGDDRRLDAALGVIYDRLPAQAGAKRSRRGGFGRSAPTVARWLGDIRRYFPASVVQVLQRDAIERFDLRQLLFEPELVDSIEVDVSLVTLVIELNRLLPTEVRETARRLVGRVVAGLEQRFAERTRQAVDGAASRADRTRRPRHADIDWNRTVLANLQHWLPEHRTVVPERLVGYERRRSGLARQLVIGVDQSGSMADSVVYASVMACVLARLRTLQTSLFVFDTTVADLTHLLADPVDVLFGVQLGGGTDLAQAAAHARAQIARPRDSIVVLVSDLYESGDPTLLVSRVAAMVRDGISVLCLLALSDDGVGAFDHHNAAALAAVGASVCGCTPDRLGELLAAVIDRRDIGAWAAAAGFAHVTAT